MKERENRLAVERWMLGLCVATSLALCVATGSSWKYKWDEGTTVDVAIYPIVKSEFLREWPSKPLPVRALYARFNGESPYSVRDTVEALDDTFRTFHPPAFYVLLHLWAKRFGTGRFWFRLPAYVLTALSVLGVFLIARRVIPGGRAGLWAAALFAASPWMASITNYVRPYCLAIALTVWSTVALLAIHGRGPRSRWRVLFVLLSLLGLYTVYHYAFVLAWQLALLAWLAWRTGAGRRLREFAALAGSGLVILAGFAPWMGILKVHLHYSARRKNYFQGAIESSEWPSRAADALKDFALGDALLLPGGVGLSLAVAVLGIGTLLLLPLTLRVRADRPADRRVLPFWLSAPLLPLLLLLSDLWRGSHTLFMPKICFGFFPLLVLLVVRCWTSVPWPALRVAGLTGWFLVLATASTLIFRDRAVARDGPQHVAALLDRADTNRHLVVLESEDRAFLAALLFTMRDAGVEDVLVTRADTTAMPGLIEYVKSTGRFDRVSFVVFRPGAVDAVFDAVKASGQVITRAKPPAWTARRKNVRPNRAAVPPEVWVIGPTLLEVLHGTQVD